MKERFRVTFYKKIFHGMDNASFEKASFIGSFSTMFDAYDEAVRRGHNPARNILVERV